jgi:hypothetical protein
LNCHKQGKVKPISHFDRVFFRGDKHRGPASACLVDTGLPVTLLEAIVIGKKTNSFDFHSKSLNIPVKTARISNRSDQERWTGLRAHFTRGIVIAPLCPRDEMLNLLNTMKDQRIRLDAPDRNLNRIPARILPNAVDYKKPGAMQSTKRFTQCSSRKHAVFSQGLRPVDHQNIKVSLQTAMLKSIIENKQRMGGAPRDFQADRVSVRRDAKP